MAVDHLLLNLLWLVGCLPLVTVPVSTAALFEVARRRARDDDQDLWRSFAAAFRQYLRPALAIGLGWAALGAVLAVDLLVAARMSGPAGTVLLVALLVLLVLYALVSVTLFPVLVSFQARPRDQLRTAAVVAVLAPARGLLALVAVAAAVAVVWTVPLAVLLVPSLLATLLLHLYQGAFDRLCRPADQPSFPHLAMSSLRR